MDDWQEILYWVTVFHLFAVLLWEILGHYAFFRIPYLRQVACDEPLQWPSVAIIFAAKDEQREIEEAVRSMLKVDYPNLKYTAVNDRSTDQTGDILNRLAEEDERLNVVHVEELPDGWLGKNNALHQAAVATDTDYLLFTDADVSFDAECVKRAIGYTESHGVDHLTMFPKVPMPGLMLNAFVVFFFKTFVLYYQAWRVSNRNSKAFLGIGAFNLVRNNAFREVGGFLRIRMEVVDDLWLGKLLKQGGFRQQALIARDDISVPWYGSIREMIVGLDKNTYAGVNYNPLLWMTMILGVGLGFFWPFAAIFFYEGPLQILFAWICGVLMVSSGWMAIRMKITPCIAVCVPFIVAIFIFTIMRAGIIFYIRGGIKWRGTLYTKEQLQSGRF
ncbi:MAG: glycosyl transferase [Planctomycetaceae bacterium]|nr:glycosyl transferase [Planctomycetaceae bacterium]